MPRQPSFTIAPPPPPALLSNVSLPQAVVPTHALVASSARFTGKVKQRVFVSSDKGWQHDCYEHYRICGEARFAARFYGHAMSKLVLYVADRDGTRLTDGESTDLLETLFAGRDGQEEMLEAFGVHFTIAGELYLVGRQAVTDEEVETSQVLGVDQIWEVVSVEEMHVTGATWSIRHQGYSPIELTDDDTVIRIWNPDPADRMRADSPFKSLLPVLDEIRDTTRHIFSQLQSRLTGAGLLLLSQGITFPAPPEAADGSRAPLDDATSFMYLLANEFVRNVNNDGTAQALAPIVAMVPEEVMKTGKAAELIKFWSDLDEKVLEMRNQAIHRFAIGLDMPPEQLLGMSSNPGTGGGTSTGVSHWSAWQIQESTITLFIEPAGKVFVNSLTVSYLRPALSAISTDKIAFDVSALKLRPDRSKEATELGDRGLLKAEVELRENGFDPATEMATEKDIKLWILRKIATGSATPEMVWGAAAFFGVDLPKPAPSALPPFPGEQVPQAPDDRSLYDHPVNDLPEASLIPVYESLALRALERAGNRIRKAAGNPPIGVPSYAAHTVIAANGSTARVLEDAWATAPLVLEGDVEGQVKMLNAYCVGRITSQKPHTREALKEHVLEHLGGLR